MSKGINYFVSHYHKDMDYLSNLKNLLNKKGYNVRDSSMDESEDNNAQNKDYIKSILRPKIKWAGTVITLIGPETHEREWVNWEIEYAASFGNKRIIGIYLRGCTDADIPENLNKFGDALVAWNSDKLEAAIEGEPLWLDKDDNPRKPYWSARRSEC